MNMPLFQAVPSQSCDYFGSSRCCFCEQTHVDVFEVASGADVHGQCNKCGFTVLFDADTKGEGRCPSCLTTAPFPELDDKILVCGKCLSDQRASFHHETEAGSITWESRQEEPAYRRTRGAKNDLDEAPTRPVIELPDCTMTTTPSGWHEVNDLAQADATRSALCATEVQRLLATPRFASFQQQEWLICCNAFMAFVGIWERAKFNEEHPTGQGRHLFRATIRTCDAELWDTEVVAFYGVTMFHCAYCQKRRGFCDFT